MLGFSIWIAVLVLWYRRWSLEVQRSTNITGMPSRSSGWAAQLWNMKNNHLMIFPWLKSSGLCITEPSCCFALHGQSCMNLRRGYVVFFCLCARYSFGCLQTTRTKMHACCNTWIQKLLVLVPASVCWCSDLCEFCPPFPTLQVYVILYKVYVLPVDLFKTSMDCCRVLVTNKMF